LAGLLIALAWFFVSAAPAQAQHSAADQVKWTAEVNPAEVPAGMSAQLHLHAEISDGWHMYALDSPPPTRGVKVEFAPTPAGISVGETEQSDPEEGFDPNFGLDVRYFEGEADLFTPINVSDAAASGTAPLTGKIGFMVCNDRLCLPPTSVPLSASMVVTGGAAQAKAPGPAVVAGRDAPPASSAVSSEPGDSVASAGLDPTNPATLGPSAELPTVTDDLEDARSGGMWGFILLAIGAGFGALLTPCVFPMIPLTVSFFTRHAGEERGSAVRMAGIYGIAIVLTFTGLGLLMALLLGAAGAQTIAANPWLNLFIGIVFVIFALSLLGLFELRLPQGLVNYFNRQGNERAGYVG
ncbi:MAG TPA: protein-disulfide reductase DsbD domain-containing protein, partial [Isosphaeraceae bacterium]|nr:protein-disulfide reductase DsbD domain-containing protein [Isosphaeraceae bacterium]